MTGGNIGKFARVIGREKDVVMLQIEPGSARVRKPDECGKGTLMVGHIGDRAGAAFAKLALGESGWIGVAKHHVCMDCLARGQPHPAGTAVVDQQLRNLCSGADGSAASPRKVCKRASKRVDAAVDQPHAFCLGMRNQHQRGR